MEDMYKGAKMSVYRETEDFSEVGVYPKALCSCLSSLVIFEIIKKYTGLST